MPKNKWTPLWDQVDRVCCALLTHCPFYPQITRSCPRNRPPIYPSLPDRGHISSKHLSWVKAFSFFQRFLFTAPVHYDEMFVWRGLESGPGWPLLQTSVGDVAWLVVLASLHCCSSSQDRRRRSLFFKLDMPPSDVLSKKTKITVWTGNKTGEKTSSDSCQPTLRKRCGISSIRSLFLRPPKTQLSPIRLFKTASALLFKKRTAICPFSSSLKALFFFNCSSQKRTLRLSDIQFATSLRFVDSFSCSLSLHQGYHNVQFKEKLIQTSQIIKINNS